MLKRPLHLRLLDALADRRGVAALEFALIAPVVIFLYFGLSELSCGIMAARRTNQASASVGDLIAQCTNINPSDSANIFSAANDILAPLPVTTLQLRSTSVVQTTSSPSSTVVRWSATPSGQAGLSAYPLATPLALPAGLTNNMGDTVIVSEAVYQFNFPIDLFNGLIHFNDVSYYKPRRSQAVNNTGPVASGGDGTNTSCYAS